MSTEATIPDFTASDSTMYVIHLETPQGVETLGNSDLEMAKALLNQLIWAVDNEKTFYVPGATAIFYPRSYIYKFSCNFDPYA